MAEETKSTLENKEQLLREVLPPEGDERLGYEVFNILNKVLEDKDSLGVVPRMHRNYELVRNKHWKSKVKTKVPLLTANLIYTHLQRTVNMLTDNNPTFNIARVGMEEGQEETYDSLLRIAEYWWLDQEQQDVLEESVMAGETNGVTIEKICFNPEREYGMGEVETIVVDPHHFGFYPVKQKDIQKCDVVLHFWPMSVREARRRWPDHAEAIIADKELLKDFGDSRREIQAGSTTGITAYFASIGNAIKTILNKWGLVSSEEDAECLIVEAWAKDYTKNIETKTRKRKGEEIQEDIETDKYPGNIRRVTVCNAGKLVLDDAPNPSINLNKLKPKQAIKTYLYDKFPFTKTVSHKDQVNPWGFSDLEQLEQLVIEVDKTLSQFTLFKDRSSRLKVINPRNTGVSNSAFTNKPSVVNPRDHIVAQGIRYMDPPQAPIDLQNALQVYKDLFFLVAGSFELELAQAPGRDVIAYKAIAALLERATTMLKGKVRGYSKMIRERGRMYLSHVQNWYTEERYITYKEAGRDVPAKVRGIDLVVPAKLTVISGSTMPRSKIQEREEAIELWKLEAIDREALLQRIDWSDWKDVVQRMAVGELGPFFEMLAQMSVPMPIIQLFQEVAGMEPKELEKALKDGELPDFISLLNTLQQGEGNAGQGPPPPTPEEQKTGIEIEKTKAEIALIQARIQTEVIEQQIKQEEAQIKRAEAVAGMRPPEAKEEGKGEEGAQK